jgi:hypothetical protein
MSQFYTVRQTPSNNQPQVITVTTNSVSSVTNSLPNSTSNSKKYIVVSEAAGTSVSDSTRGQQVEVNLSGMASSALPSSANLFVNYPHTMWERDSEGNRIPVTVVKAEEANAAEVQDAAEHLLVQATNIKTEAAEVDSNTTVTTITIPAASGSSTVTVPTATHTSSPTQRIVVMKTADNVEPVARPHVCEVCTKTFAKREHLTKHLRIHKSDNKRYSCEYCQKAFRDRYELVRHTRRHTGDFPFRCQECNKGFMRHERYMTHLRWHSGERPYLCTMCEKSFRDRSELNRHSRRHTGDLPYKCETCGKGFLRRERYVTHVRIHTGEKPFVCAVCSRGYRDRRELKKHQTTHNHSGQSAPIPGTGPVTIPPPNAASATSNTTAANNLQNVVTKTIVVQQPQSPTSMATTSNAVHLPSTPVPKELLNINGGTRVVTQSMMEPLNPANIPLPPSVASALQSINEKVTRQQRQKQLEAEAQATVVKTEPLISIQGSPTGGTSNGPLFYYLMPGSVPYSLTADGGTTVQVKTSDGSIATAQLVTVPSGAIHVGASGAQSSNGNAANATANGPTSWILETTGNPTSPPSVSRNSM